LTFNDASQPFDWGSYFNCIWYMLITFTTVGYGDYFACTALGKLFGILACLVGNILVSLFVVSLSQALLFTKP